MLLTLNITEKVIKKRINKIKLLSKLFSYVYQTIRLILAWRIILEFILNMADTILISKKHEELETNVLYIWVFLKCYFALNF